MGSDHAAPTRAFLSTFDAPGPFSYGSKELRVSYHLSMRQVLCWASIGILAVCGCGPKEPKAETTKAPSGWSLQDRKEVPFILSFPAGFEVRVMSADDLRARNPVNKESLVISKPGLLASMTVGDGTRVVTAYRLESNLAMNTDEWAEVVAEGPTGRIDAGENTTVKLPAGSAKLLTAHSDIQGRKGEVVMYIVPYGKFAYVVGLIDFPPQKDTRIAAQDIAQTLAIRGEKG